MERNILSVQKYQNYEYIVDKRLIKPIIADIQRLKPIKFGKSEFKPFAVDTETTGLDIFKNRLLLLQLAVDGNVYVIDARKVDISPFKFVLESDAYLHIIQNAKFDWKVLYKHKNIRIKSIYDTQLAESLIQAGNKNRETNLGYLAKNYCDITLHKEVVSSFVDFLYDDDFTKQQLDYAANDVRYLEDIFKNQLSYLQKLSLLQIANLEFKLIEPVSIMELKGIILDSKRWETSLNEVNDKLFSLKADLRQVLPDPAPPPPKPIRYKKDGTPFKKDLVREEKPLPILNLDSWQQVVWAMSQVGIDLKAVNEKTKAGLTNVRTLKLASTIYNISQEKSSVLKNFMRYRALNQTVKTFGENLISWILLEDGRIHAEFHQDGTMSGRFSCSDPNLENIQKKGNEGRILRSCFVPPKGYKFIIADYSQIELRIAAELSGDENMIDILCDPRGDVHRLTAAIMFGIPYELVTKEMRDAAKTLNFGIIYGMTVRTLQERLNCEYADAVSHMQNYHKSYKTLLRWIEDRGQRALAEGKSTTIGGRIRWFPPENNLSDKEKGFYLRVGRNHPIQGCSADMTKSAIVMLYTPLMKLDSFINNCIHDELLIEAPIDKAIEVAMLVKERMISAGQKYLKQVPVLVDIKIRDCWWKDDGVNDNECGQQLWLMPPEWMEWIYEPVQEENGSNEEDSISV